MDAIDVDWCLMCGRHTDGNTAYCSSRCFSSHSHPDVSSRYCGQSSKPSSRMASPHFPAVVSPHDEDEDDEQDDGLAQYRQPHHPPRKSAWIGKGLAGIHTWARDVTPGPPAEPELKPTTPVEFSTPKLMQSHARPVPPTLCMSTTETVHPVPSLPIRTPHQVAPAVSANSMTNPSLTSLTTGISTSIATPASEQQDDPPSAETQRVNFITALTSQLRPFASKSSLRSKTVTRKQDPPPASLKSRPRAPAPPPASAPRRRAYSPVPFYMPDVPPPSEKPREPLVIQHHKEKVQPRTDDHPAFRMRGRKMARPAP
ncbi:hypothetical protein K474DRAFT_1672815 [Panus rudis PR-1116 ss-1]|nr:hypothetical protein K474DRAFT_1672815 [Panus rudis PR-1116 ss-1]